MTTVRPEHECTPDGEFVYYVTYIGKDDAGNSVRGWLTTTVPRKVRNVRDIIMLSDRVKEQCVTAPTNNAVKEPVLLSFQQIEAVPEEEAE